MADINQKVVQVLNPQEEEELRDGQSLYEMERNNPGWQIIKRWLEAASIHSWVDPREIENSLDAKKEWEWRELNAFHAANNAKEILENIAKSASRADYLAKVKSGEIKRQSMKIG